MRSRHKSFRRRISLVASVFVLLILIFILWASLRIKSVDFILWLIGTLLLLLVAYGKTRVYVEEDKIVIRKRKIHGSIVEEIPLKDIEEIYVSEPEQDFMRIDLFRIFMGKRPFLEDIYIKGKRTVERKVLFWDQKKQTKTSETIQTLRLLSAQKSYALLSVVSCLVERARLLVKSEKCILGKNMMNYRKTTIYV